MGQAGVLQKVRQMRFEGLLERHERGEALRLGADPEHCHLFDQEGRAFDRKIVEVLSAA